MSLIPTPTSATRTLTSLGVATLSDAHLLRRRTESFTAQIGPIASVLPSLPAGRIDSSDT